MTFKAGAVSALGCVALMAACAPLGSNYWKRVDYDSALYLTGPKAVEQLHHDIAACTDAVDNMSRMEALRNAVPPDTDPGARAGDPLSYSDSPERLGDKKVAHTDFHDFEGCMLAAGWMRQNYIRPQTMLKAQNDYKDTQSLRMTGMTTAEKQAADMEALQARRDALVKPGTTLSFGLQGYHDTYKEPDVDVTTNTKYWGGSFAYTSRSLYHVFWTVDARVARGDLSYSSPSGVMSGVPEYEGELRLTGGKDYAWGTGWLSPYMGLGVRSYRMLGKGHVTDLGAYAYDRRIDQLYVPLGVTWRTLMLQWWPFSANLELDPLLVGQVDSRLQNAGGPDIVNVQSPGSGFAVRGEMMFGVPVKGAVIEAGPFFRYWNVRDSEVKALSCGGGFCIVGLEPYNTRVQVGVAVRANF